MDEGLRDYLELFSEEGRSARLATRGLATLPGASAGTLPGAGGTLPSAGGALPSGSDVVGSQRLPGAPVGPASTPRTGSITGRASFWTLDWNISGQALFDRTVAFERTVAAVESATKTLQDDYRAKVQAPGVRPVFTTPARFIALEMPIAGTQCPPGGGLAFVFWDLGEAAKRNLRALADNPPTKLAQPRKVAVWDLLVRWNIALLVRALNIRPTFLFPTAYPRQYPVSRPAEWMGDSDRATKQTQVGDSQYKSGAPYPNPFVGVAAPSIDASRGETRSAAYVAVDRLAAAVRPYGADALDPGNRPQTVFDLDADLERELAERPVTVAALPRLFEITVDPHESRIPGGTVQSRWGYALVQQDPSVTVEAIALSMRDPVSSGVGRGIDYVAQVARAWSNIDLKQTIQQSIGFYVFNHLVWWSDRLGLTPTQLTNLQRDTMQASFSGATAIYRSIGSTVAGAVNPTAAIIVGILNMIADPLMRTFVFDQLETDGPKLLWMRMPPLSCTPTYYDVPTSSAKPTEEQKQPLSPTRINVLRSQPFIRLTPAPSAQGGGAAVPLAATAAILWYFFL